MSKPRLLDLYAGAGGAARGYQMAGFHVTGIDHVPQPRYAGDVFIQADALEYVAERGREYDAIHASPPCQAHTTMSARWRGSGGKADAWPDLIGVTREQLEATDVLWVLENVPGALGVMRSPIRLMGEMFGLRVHRPRLFESPWLLMTHPAKRQPDPVAVYGKQDGRRLWTRVDGSELRAARLPEASEAMGIDWMTWDELSEAIPPAYTNWVGEQLMRVLTVVA